MRSVSGREFARVVERRGWITKKDYVDGLALAQLAPGPLAAQLAIYLGWVKGGVLGGTGAAAAFMSPARYESSTRRSVRATTFASPAWQPLAPRMSPSTNEPM